MRWRRCWRANSLPHPYPLLKFARLQCSPLLSALLRCVVSRYTAHRALHPNQIKTPLDLIHRKASDSSAEHAAAMSRSYVIISRERKSVGGFFCLKRDALNAYSQNEYQRTTISECPVSCVRQHHRWHVKWPLFGTRTHGNRCSDMALHCLSRFLR